MWMRASQKRRTTIQPEGKAATWNESFKLPVHIAEAQKLELVLYDHDNIGSDDELGRSAPVHQISPLLIIWLSCCGSVPKPT